MVHFDTFFVNHSHYSSCHHTLSNLQGEKHDFSVTFLLAITNPVLVPGLNSAIVSLKVKPLSKGFHDNNSFYPVNHSSLSLTWFEKVTASLTQWAPFRNFQLVHKGEESPDPQSSCISQCEFPWAFFLLLLSRFWFYYLFFLFSFEFFFWAEL